MNFSTMNTYTLIRELWHKSSIETIKHIIDTTEDLNLEITDAIGITPLGQALVNNNTEIIKLLLDKGANPNTKSRGTYPIFYAIENDNIDALKYLIDYGADLYVKEKDNNPLLHALGFNTNYPIRENIFKLLIDLGCDYNYKNSDGISVIIILAYWNLTELFEYVLDINKLLNTLDLNDYDFEEYNNIKYKFTVFYYVCFNSNEQLAKLLIENGVDYNDCLNMINEYGEKLIKPVEQDDEEIYVLEKDENGCQIYRKKEKTIKEPEIIDFVKIVNFATEMVNKYSC
jgi:ankyrin repeat protein